MTNLKSRIIHQTKKNKKKNQYLYFTEQSLGATTRPLPFLAPLQTTSHISIKSCFYLSTQLILLLFPVPVSIIMCLFLQKNIIVIGSQSSYIVLKSGTFWMSTTQKVTNLHNFGATLIIISSICMHLGSQSVPNLITTSFYGSFRMAWSTYHPLSRCGIVYDILISNLFKRSLLNLLFDQFVNLTFFHLLTSKKNELAETTPQGFVFS